MNRRLKALWIAPTLLLALACSQAEDEASMSMASGYISAINAVREDEAAMLNTEAVDNIAHVYAADIVMMPPDEPTVMGRDASQEWFATFIEMFAVDLEYTSSDLTVAGDWAIERYTGTATLTPRDGGETVTQTLKGIHVYRLQPDGSWLIVQDIWNNDEPTAEGH